MKEIILSNGEKCQVDDEDYDEMNKIKWHADKRGSLVYVNSHGGRIHRIIMKANDSKVHVDHIDGNGLNNQKINLRLCSAGQNVCNSKLRKNNKSGFKGVSQYTAAKVWKDYYGPVYRARIIFKDKEISLGYFKCPKEAAKARDLKAKELHGEFAKLNLF